jgi:hypothetical protein
MDERPEHQPGTRAPVTGHYEELNIFGTPTGRVEHVREGEHLPDGPRGFTWRQTEDKGC